MPSIKTERSIYDATNNEVLVINVTDRCFNAIKTMVESDDRYEEAWNIVTEIAEIQHKGTNKPDFDLVIPDNQ